MQITSKAGLVKSTNRGAIFENFIVSEMLKNRSNKILEGDLFFFRDSAGNEVDMITTKNEHKMAFEIKSNKKFKTNQLTGLRWWNKLNRSTGGYFIYGGNENSITFNNIEILYWKNADAL
jgi:predicted AAA+ superfamily ATPase